MRELYDRGQIQIENLLGNAQRQAEERRLHEFTIVDVDSHHYEDRRWDEIIPYIDDDQIRDWARAMTQRSGKAAATTITTAQLGHQEISGRVLRAGRNQLASQHDLGASKRHDDVVRTIWSMDMMGIDYTVMFPTPMLHLSLHPAPEVEVALARAYTRWLTEELLPQDDRIKTLVYLPFNDPAASLAFVEEFADVPGVVGFMVTSIRYRGVHANEYAPVYSAIQDTGKPLAFHAAYNWHEQAMTQLNKFISAHALGFTFCNIIHLTNMLVNAIPERFPRLKLIWVESGLAWIPFLMQRLDNEYLMRTSECPGLKRLPSEYMREMYYSTQPMERTGSPALMKASFEEINAENTLLYSSDYPHWDFDVPSVILDLPFLSEHAKRRILGGNALDLFGLPAGKRAPRAAATRPAFTGGEPIEPALS
ncbi:amidohydrolase family protein [Pseudonocardia acaciae]|uniref:amidohydrolase family protein n=1 Tax=Pseudonocardia acaciae TaxID=551276 RepID=UPI00068602AB|nr:amidohydrolase family protein [Pseudonocardia acaciae]